MYSANQRIDANDTNKTCDIPYSHVRICYIMINMSSENPVNPTGRFTKIYLLLWSLCVILALIALIFYKFGYRLTANFTPTKIGAINITSNQSNIKIFLNNREKIPTIDNDRYVVRNVIPGVHSLIVSKDDFWPWFKTFQLNNSETRDFYSFMFPMKGAGVSLVEHGEEYEKVLKFFTITVLPELKSGNKSIDDNESMIHWLKNNVPNYKISIDGTTALFTEKNTIRIAWISESKPPPSYFCEINQCQRDIQVLVSNLPLSSVEFYKDRNDVIIFSAGSSIYGIDVDRNGTQNFQPFYKGNNPIIYKADADTLYIEDGASLMRAKQ